ncbi:Peptidase M1 membrane alanine aminopeptidase [Segniliparus rotundus DSM 44985]|uniref:Aminopeptidase N n=1 Tax=Segniliparus rotundus (strain ATCC BAA-972 / CDC 1076 / CIP 108378 / DSM 44985 / JCM 13578) TaxID=640132 RepID=D6ZE17_SEGRD|nr:M1 family metallopeptidase [Segniliparus rotundus]ADG97297.1 Peptidase M1 membrane alanine aminopeptidase [Segniliparus rotundus DSM 44985]
MSGPDPYCPGQGNTGYDVARYELDLGYQVSSGRLAGEARIFLTTTAPASELSFDMSEHLKVGKLAVDGHRPARHRHRAGKLVLGLKSVVPSGKRLKVVVQYSGNPKPIRTIWGEVGFEELADGALVASQPNGAHSWYPCDDRPTSKAPHRFEIAVPNGYRAVCNGKLVGRKTKSSQTIWTYEQAEPMAPYLSSLQVGRYELVTLSEQPTPDRVAAPSDLARRLDSSFGRHPQMLRVFAELFGPYPFAEHTTVVTADELEIPIEAQGMSVFGAQFVPETPAQAAGRDPERLISHELAHQWFGNSVTCAQWRDIWLHEGFACYAEWLWSERSGGQRAAFWAAKHHKRLSELPQDLLLSDPGPKDMFDDRVYKRGALTLHALRTVVGDEAFFHVLRTFTARFRHANAATEDFINLVDEVGRRGLASLWQQWLYERALPELP